MNADQLASLIDILASATPQEKCDAAYAIAQLDEEAAPAVPALIAALSDRSHDEEESCDQGFPTGFFYPVHVVATAAAEALGVLGEAARDALPSLKSLLSSKSGSLGDDESKLRASAAAAIARIAVPSPQLRTELLEMLIDVDDKHPVSELLLKLFSDDSAVATCVAKYLCDTGGLQLAIRLAAQRVRPQEVVPVLVSWLQPGNVTQIVRAIARFGPEAELSTDELLTILTRSDLIPYDETGEHLDLGQADPLGPHQGDVIEMFKDIGALGWLRYLRDMLGTPSQEIVATIDLIVPMLEGDSGNTEPGGFPNGRSD